jgi:pilus assembly protein CpaE
MADKILIVDDEIDTLRLVGLMLERQGYSIVAAEGGEQALEVVRREKPDLILLDVMMPDLDGLEVARQIRSDEELGDIPIIMFTAKTQVEDKVMGLEAGADVYLTKPTQPRELFAQVKVLLARSKKTLTTPLPRTDSRGNLIGVISAKGGVGVTTLVINLGISLHKITNQDVLIADFHPGRGDISWELGLHAQLGTNELLDHEADSITRKSITEVLVEHDSGVRLLLSSQSPKEAVQFLEVEKFKAIASKLPFTSTWSIMDLGSNLLPTTQSLAKLCDTLLIAVSPISSSIKQSKALYDDLVTIGVSGDRISMILVNKVRSAVQMNQDQVENELGMKLLAIFTPAPELAFQASTANLPMVVHQENSITSQQFEKLASKIANQNSRE